MLYPSPPFPRRHHFQESELNDTITLQEAKTSVDSTEKQRLSRISDSVISLLRHRRVQVFRMKLKDKMMRSTLPLLSQQRHLRHAMRAKKSRAQEPRSTFPRDLTLTRRPLLHETPANQRRGLNHPSILILSFGAFRKRTPKFRKHRLNCCEG